jgi:DNA mismatch repair protein MutL
MAADEAKLALIRHATSKLRRIEDLYALETLGFRGEALPSIAAVSRMTLITRRHQDSAGTRVLIEAGKIVEVGAVGAAPGTQVEVRDLLFNVPARQKFLRGEVSEAAHVTEVVTRLALGHPEVDIELKHPSRIAVRAPLHRDRLERIRAILGSRLGRELSPVHGREGDVSVTAYLAAPELAQTTARGVQLFVGRRAVRDRGLLHALVRGYGELLPRGRYPVAVLFVEVAGGKVDVNVHPQKLEVRFADPQGVYAAVRHAVAQGVAEAPWLAERVGVSGAPAFAVTPSGGASRVAVLQAAETQARWLWPTRRLSTAMSPAVTSENSPQPPAGKVEPSWRAPVGGTGSERRLPATSEFAFASLQFLGQLDRTYLLCQGEGEFVVVDQHAAHERVLFERLRVRQESGLGAMQPLLFSETVEVDPLHAAQLDEFGSEFLAAGFDLERFGETGGQVSLALKAAPAGLRGDPKLVVRQLLEELADRGGSRAAERPGDLVLATIACHSAVRAGDPLSPSEVEALFADLDETPNRAHCPHGRPVVWRMTMTEVARRFART